MVREGEGGGRIFDRTVPELGTTGVHSSIQYNSIWMISGKVMEGTRGYNELQDDYHRKQHSIVLKSVKESWSLTFPSLYFLSSLANNLSNLRLSRQFIPSKPSFRQYQFPTRKYRDISSASASQSSDISMQSRSSPLSYRMFMLSGRRSRERDRLRCYLPSLSSYRLMAASWDFFCLGCFLPLGFYFSVVLSQPRPGLRLVLMGLSSSGGRRLPSAWKESSLRVYSSSSGLLLIYIYILSAQFHASLCHGLSLSLPL